MRTLYFHFVVLFFSPLYFCPVVSSFFFFPSPNLSRRRLGSTILPHMVWPYGEFRMQIWNVLHAARWKYSTQKGRQNRHLDTTAQICRVISSQLRHVSTIRKNSLSSNMSSRCPHNMVNFGPLAAEIGLPVWAPQLIPTAFASWIVTCDVSQSR